MLFLSAIDRLCPQLAAMAHEAGPTAEARAARRAALRAIYSAVRGEEERREGKG